MPLPEGVQIVKSRGREYLYYAPGRGTARAGKRVRLPDDPRSEAFWRAVSELRGVEGGRTFTRLIAEYTASPEWKRLRPASQRDYRVYLARIERAWGAQLVSELRPAHVLALRDAMADTPSAANLTLSILRTIIKWGIPREFSETNPAREIAKLKTDSGGAQPWPVEAWRYVLATAPDDIRRAVYLGRQTGQRISDVVRMRPVDRHLDGINVRIGKLRDKRHWVPLPQDAIVEIDGWPNEPMQPYLMTRDGRPYTSKMFTNRWQVWRKRHAPVTGLNMHGLRAMAVCDRRAAGYAHQKIAAQIGMSVGMVEHYSRFGDQMAFARND